MSKFQRLSQPLILITALIFSAFLSFELSAKRLKVAINEENYPPYYYSDNANYQGATIEILEYVCAQLGYTIEFVKIPLARLPSMMQAKDIDLISFLYKTKEREQLYFYTEEAHLSDTVHLFSTRNIAIEYHGDLQSLEGKKIGVVNDLSNGENFDSQKQLFQIDPARTWQIQIKKLIIGRYPLAIGSKAATLYHAEQLQQADNIRFLEPAVSKNPVFMAFNRASPANQHLAKQFSQVIKSYKSTTQYQELLEKYQLNLR